MASWENTESNGHYDFGILYEEDYDEDMAVKITEYLETQGKIRGYVAGRDANLGESIFVSLQIIAERTKFTLILLTKKFLDSAQGLNRLKQQVTQFSKAESGKLDTIIPIMFGINETEIPFELKGIPAVRLDEGKMEACCQEVLQVMEKGSNKKEFLAGIPGPSPVRDLRSITLDIARCLDKEDTNRAKLLLWDHVSAPKKSKLLKVENGLGLMDFMAQQGLITDKEYSYSLLHEVLKKMGKKDLVQILQQNIGSKLTVNDQISPFRKLLYECTLHLEKAPGQINLLKNLLIPLKMAGDDFTAFELVLQLEMMDKLDDLKKNHYVSWDGLLLDIAHKLQEKCPDIKIRDFLQAAVQHIDFSNLDSEQYPLTANTGLLPQETPSNIPGKNGSAVETKDEDLTSNIQYEKISAMEMKQYIKQSPCIGKGGFGKVYKGCKKYRNVEVAIKVSHDNASRIANSDSDKQFQMELQTAPIKNPFVVPIFAVTQLIGQPYCIMYPYMEGGDLENRLFQKNGSQKGVLTWKERVQIAYHVSQGLLCYHTVVPDVREKPILHRDVKPGNILLDKLGNACLSDPSLAKEVDEAKSSVTAPGMGGTPGYIDPDIASRFIKDGQKFKFYERNDVYSFGIVMLQLLLNQGPFIDQKQIVEYLKDEHILDFGAPLSQNVHNLASHTAKMSSELMDNKEFCELILGAIHADTKQRLPLQDISKRLQVLCEKVGQTAYNYETNKESLELCVGCKLNKVAKYLSLRSANCDNPASPCCLYCKDCYMLAYRNPLVCPTHGPAEPPIGHKNTYAVVVGAYHFGIGQYIFARDALGISNALSDHRIIGGLREGKNLFTYSPALTTAKPTSSNILDRIRQIKEEVANLEDATFIFYYSGHCCNGTELVLKEGSDVLSQDQLCELFSDLNVVELLVVMDCCYAASFDTLSRSSSTSSTDHHANKCQSEIPILVKDTNGEATHKARPEGHDGTDGAQNKPGPNQSDSSRFCQVQWSASGPDQQARGFVNEYSMFTKHFIAGLQSGVQCALNKKNCKPCEKLRKLSEVHECVTLPNLGDYVSDHIAMEAHDKELSPQQPQTHGSMREIFKMAYSNSKQLYYEYPCRHGRDNLGKARIERIHEDFEVLKSQIWRSIQGFISRCITKDDLIISSDKCPISDIARFNNCKDRGSAIEVYILDELKQLTPDHAVFLRDGDYEAVIKVLDSWKVFVEQRDLECGLLEGVKLHKLPLNQQECSDGVAGRFQVSVPKDTSIDFNATCWEELENHSCFDLIEILRFISRCITKDDLILSSDKCPISDIAKFNNCKDRGSAIEVYILDELKQLTPVHAVFLDDDYEAVIKVLDNWKECSDGVAGRFKVSVPKDKSIDFTATCWEELENHSCFDLIEILRMCQQKHAAINIQVQSDGYIRFEMILRH
ncbi:unnamed protein product [Owenia fusiformis]|uniref:Uncharacterized protein n=1 Tax=Owenia fusiformis TaxID=6347 RepID=A0A8J1XXJ7_OWEFU|nr:unnamed protein product [Owenia fusiformis]